MNWINKLQADIEKDERLKTDLPYFPPNLKIRPKVGPPVPLLFNAAQRKLHALIEEQKARTGRVRVIVLKAR